MVTVILEDLKAWNRAKSSSQGVSVAGRTGEEEEDKELAVSIDGLLNLLYARDQKVTRNSRRKIIIHPTRRSMILPNEDEWKTTVKRAHE